VVYKHDPTSDVGLITLKIADLPNPLGGTFDLSKCGESGQFLGISTGYRKGRKPENQNKVEIWVAPKFMIAKKLKSLARHFERIIDDDCWNEAVAPVGLFFTWGGWDNLRWYHYLTRMSAPEISSQNLFENWKATRSWVSLDFYQPNTENHQDIYKKFHVDLCKLK